jgi:Mg-chelatase subunit ChlD
VSSPAPGVERYRLLATFVAGRPIEVAQAPTGEAAHTNGDVVFVSQGSAEEQRREVLVQCALLAADSLDRRFVKPLRARPSMGRKYLFLEGRRALADLAIRLPLAAALQVAGGPNTESAEESLEIARRRAKVADPPEWFGVIKPSLLFSARTRPAGRPIAQDLRGRIGSADVPDDDEDDPESGESKILKLFETPIVVTNAFSNFLRNMLGTSRTPGNDGAGGEFTVGSIRKARAAGANARPLSTRIHFTDAGKPAAAIGVGGALHPEWDVYNNRYRTDHCRVLDFPLAVTTDVSVARAGHDDELRRRLSRVGLGTKVMRGCPDGDELDIESLIDLYVDLRSGYSAPENVYVERRKIARDLGILILLDTSGSATDTNAQGFTVHVQQRRAAATLAATLEELGDRVAVYAFRSHGRDAVHLPAVKTFDQRFDAAGRARLNQLEPSGYTRLGAGIRGAGEILKAQAGTPNRLLLVLSDGFPYDVGYEGRYGEADTHKALQELRADGVACLCLSIGAGASTESLERVFGPASHASAPTLADLSPRMDELFLGALKELAAPMP